MKVLILSINYWPEVTGIGAFTTYRAEYLAAVGHEVEVCTTFPYYPEWKVAEPYCGCLAQSEQRRGVHIVRSYAFIPNPVTAFKRIIHEGTFVLSCFMRALFRKRPDVLFVISPPLGLALPAILLSRLWRIPYVFDVEDLQPDSAGDLRMLPAWAIKVLYKLENAAYRHAALVTTLTEGMRQRIVNKGIPCEKVELIEPRMDDALTSISSEEGAAFRRKYHLGNQFLVTYSGNMGVKQALDVVIDAAELNQSDKSTLFLFVGDGTDCDRIRRRAAQMQLPNVRFFPLLDETDFRGLISASGVCLVTQQQSVSEVAFPSKIVTYLAAGRPIVASVNAASEVARVVHESGAGRAVNAEDAKALLAAILDLRGEDLQVLSEKAREYANVRWSSARVLGHLEKSLATIASTVVTPLAQEGSIR